VEAPTGTQARIRVRVEKGTLFVSGGEARRGFGAFFGRSRGNATPRVTVRFRTIEAIDLAGSVKLTAGRLETPDLRIAASGGTTVRIDDLQ
ncbi:DUF2807 domain-containing protein, partial [Klebsiella pneumoniae]|nr:DUF2807 domain-containing protein [Klebsiella pneumoniae]